MSEGGLDRAAGWVFIILLGPLMFAGEIVGPFGHVYWRDIGAGLIGTILWILVAMAVIGYV